MALTVFRTTYSGVLKDNMDYSTGFADADGRLVAQGLTLPGHLGSVPTAHGSRSCATSATTWPTGDVFIMNDPVRRRHAPARHLRLQAALSRGRAPRLRLHRLPPHRRRRPRGRARMPPTRPRSTPKGLRIAPMKLYEAGKLNKTIMTFIEKNVRAAGARCSATCARSSPPATSPSSSSPSWSRRYGADDDQALHAARRSTMPSA